MAEQTLLDLCSFDPPPGATAYNVQFSVDKSPGFTHVKGLKQESAEKISELLLLNHTKYHTFFNDAGLHRKSPFPHHIVHQLGTLWPLGATVQEIQAAYDHNKVYQIQQYRHEGSIAVRLTEPKFYKEHLGDPKYYSDFLHFFQDRIAEQGVEKVVREYLFNGDDESTDFLERLFAGLLHPIIHLGFGLELNQPLLVAEALSSTAIHDHTPKSVLVPVEKYLASNPDTPAASYISVLEGLRADPVIKNAVKRNDGLDLITNGIMRRAEEELVPHLAKWRVKPTKEDIELKMAEMIHNCTYISAASQHPKKQPAFDFMMMHSTNLSVFFPVFMGLEWLSLEDKARMLTWKGWWDMTIYAACGCPELYPSRITQYKPKKPGDWSSIASRATRYPDDGHVPKLIRACMNAERLSSMSKKYHSNPEFPLAPEEFLQVAHMCMDSVERLLEPGYQLPPSVQQSGKNLPSEVKFTLARWTRGSGVEGAWDNFPDLD